MSNNIVLFNDYKIEVGRELTEEDQEKMGQIIKSLEVFQDKADAYEGIKESYEIDKYRLEQMAFECAERFGLRSVKGRYGQFTIVPGTEGRTETIKVLDERKVLELLDELGFNKEDYFKYEEKTIGKRKASLRYKS